MLKEFLKQELEGKSGISEIFEKRDSNPAAMVNEIMRGIKGTSVARPEESTNMSVNHFNHKWGSGNIESVIEHRSQNAN